MDIMKKYSLLFALSLLLFSRADTQATTTVKVTNSGDSTSETHVRIETNGEVNSFDANDGEEVDWTSSDGQSTVKINSKTSTVSPKPTEQAESTPSASKDKSVDTNADEDTSKDSEPVKKSFSLSEFFKGIFEFFGFGKK